MKQNYSAEQVSISHAEYIKLHKENLLVLGVDNDLATRAASAGLGPKKGGTSAAYHFYSWVSIGVFVLSIYFSFISNWWWFIVGFISMMVIWNGNKKGNASNFLNSAMYDKEFYERFRDANIWIYQMEDNVAGRYKFD